MKSIEEIHAVSTSFYIIWPTGRFDKRSGSVITELVDGCDESSKVDGGVGIELIESDLGDGCSEHVSHIPPSKCKCREND